VSWCESGGRDPYAFASCTGVITRLRPSRAARPRPPSSDRRAAGGRNARMRRAGRDLPELPGVQRRRVPRADREGDEGRQPDPARARPADSVRRRARARRRDGYRWFAADRRRRRCRRGALLVHDPTRDDPGLALSLAKLSDDPTGPTPIGVFRDVSRPVYGRSAANSSAATEQDLAELLSAGETWTVG
jgi:hypothetical protein